MSGIDHHLLLLDFVTFLLARLDSSAPNKASNYQWEQHILGTLPQVNARPCSTLMSDGGAATLPHNKEEYSSPLPHS